jgi:exopolysaccharide production protein ExoZ
LAKIQNIQALRGIAVLSVVFFHLLMIERKYGGSRTILPDLFQFGMFGVDLFFVISGFVMFTVSRGKFQIPKQTLRFIYHRMARIYPTYWVYSILVLIEPFLWRDIRFVIFIQNRKGQPQYLGVGLHNFLSLKSYA